MSSIMGNYDKRRESSRRTSTSSGGVGKRENNYLTGSMEFGSTREVSSELTTNDKSILSKKDDPLSDKQHNSKKSQVAQELRTWCTMEPTSVLKLNLIVSLSWDSPLKQVRKRDVKAIQQEGMSILENFFTPCFNRKFQIRLTIRFSFRTGPRF